MHTHTHACARVHTHTHLEINLTKETKGLCSENFRTLKKEIEPQEDGKTAYAHGLAEKDTVKITTLPKANYRFSVIPVSIPVLFSTGLRKKNPKIYGETQRLIEVILKETVL